MIADKEDSENDSMNNDDDEDMENEDYDSGIKDDILRPASTRSKIVVNLKEPDAKKKRQLGKSDEIKYILDPYDKVRMQLIYEDEKLYKAYMVTINELENKLQYQPRKRQMPCYYLAPAVFIEYLILFLFIYFFFLII